MYASNLQELLLHCSEHSDLSPQVFAEYIEPFAALRDYGYLPKGRDKRGRLLTPTQVAFAILGLVPARPSWAGHAATVLKNLSPVGGPQKGFHNTASFIDAIVVLLTDTAARASLLTVRVILGETYVNSHGGAILRYQHEGARRQVYFAPRTAASLSAKGVDSSFDPEGELFSPASRAMSFGRPFFDRIARAMEAAVRHPGEPAGDGSEYDEEEAKKILWDRIGVTPQSRFLNLAADNHVTWPPEPTLVRFAGYHFVLMPRTKENIQSVHIDLVGNRLDDGSAATLIRRFLSIMAWCDDGFATLGLGWSGNPVPVAVAKPELSFRTAFNFAFDRKMPSTPEARRAIALYREALNAEHSGLISYAVLNYYKIVELVKRDRGPTIQWFRSNFAYARQFEHLRGSLENFDKLRGAVEPHDYIYKSCRIAVAHAGRHSKSDPDDASELLRLHTAADIMQVLARHFIQTEFRISDCIFDGT